MGQMAFKCIVDNIMECFMYGLCEALFLHGTNSDYFLLLKQMFE